MRKVVFLPCHPNMWEGFQTIWEKEISDPSNEVKVIPIPNYKRGTGTSVYDPEYITTGYPQNVEITGLNDYYLHEQHPDTIYVQNIQDGDNPVFAVHPDFHTTKLKDYTDDLVYIPYDCLGYIDPDYFHLKRVYSKILTPPGIKNTNRVIVYSENARTVYASILSNGNNELYDEWMKKITCEDYPRISILKKYTKDTVPYPESWNRHLFDSNGQRKQTALFATSILGVLEFNRSHLREAKDILEEYLGKKDKVALIWRPHKYLPEVIMQLRPELFDDFRSLLEFYISNDIGIFDESPTPTPAIVLSDSYIGDNCAVKELFMSTGKPIQEPSLHKD